MPTLADLLLAKTPDEREQQLLALLNAAGFPVTDWYPGGVARTLEKAFVTELGDFDSLVPQITAGGFIGPFTVGGQRLPTRDWLTLLASELFNLQVAQATFTRQSVNLWCQPGTGPYTIVAGQLTAVSTLGDRYVNLTGGVVVAGATPAVKLPLVFQAESPGALYNRDVVGTIAILVTPLPGLVIANELLPFGGLDTAGRAARNGSGTGTMTPVETVSGTAPALSRRFTLTILTAGQVGAAVGSLLVDDGVNPATTTLLSPIPASYTGAADGVTIAFANGAQDPSFLVGEIYTFQTPGSPIINAGTDIESLDSLGSRMRGRWPSLAAVPTEDKHVGWIRQASIDNGYGISKITVFASVSIAGQTEIRVATSLGAVPGPVIAALQAYVNQREGVGDLGDVESATPVNISVGGTVEVRAGVAAAVQQQADLNWASYIGLLGIGGDPPEGVARLAQLERAIMDAGAEDVSGLTLNGSAANVALGTTDVAVAANQPSSALTWVEVS